MVSTMPGGLRKKGFEKTLYFDGFTEEELRSAWNDLLTNKSCSKSVEKCSRILHHLPSQQKKVSVCIEHDILC